MTNLNGSSHIEEIGERDFPIWLLGDSPSTNKQIKELKLNLDPLDRRHPTRHTIWTPVLDVIQRYLFDVGLRLDDSRLYIQNVISEFSDENNTKILKNGVDNVRKLLENNPDPFLILSFGQFAFECVRRARKEQIERNPKYWSIKKLSVAFGERILNVQSDTITLLPLLHQSAALQFWKCNDLGDKAVGSLTIWGGNYFEYAGQEIANVLIAHQTHAKLKNLWLKKK
jgi:hypothetical protein